jgi:hypothetical protein
MAARAISAKTVRLGVASMAAQRHGAKTAGLGIACMAARSISAKTVGLELRGSGCQWSDQRSYFW